MTWAMMIGCAGNPAASCGRAYDGTVAALVPVFAGSVEPPQFPSRADYEARCAALGFTEAQLACLDPDHALGHATACAAALAPARGAVDSLAAWFAAQTVPLTEADPTGARGETP